MLRTSKEYFVDELLEHPVVRLQITSEGIERRCVDLILDATGGNHRTAKAENALPLPD